MQKKNIIFLIVLLIGMLSISNCATKARIKDVKPAKFNMGTSKKLFLVETAGLRSLREEITTVLGASARSDGWWAYEDIQNKGIKLRISGDKVNPTQKPEKGEVYLKIEAFGKQVDSDTKIQKKLVGSQQVETTVKIYVGSAQIGVTTYDSAGKSRLLERPYEGKSEIPASKGDRDQAGIEALRNAVRMFLSDITPHFKYVEVKIDDDADDMKAYKGMIKGGNYAEAAKMMEKMLETTKTRADVYYNYGVAVEATGDYEKALDAYNKALKLGGKDFYAKAQAGCAQRIANFKSLEKEN